MHTFITGSQVYGTPGPKSDVDLVVRMDADEAMRLIELSDDPPSSEVLDNYGISGLRAVRYGSLNVLICTNDTYYSCWKLGTEQCFALEEERGRKLTRNEAVAIFSKIFEENGIS